MKFLLVIVAAAAILLSSSAFAEQSRVFIESLQKSHIPAQWRLVEKAAPSTKLKLTFALKQQNVDKLESIFWAVSNPELASYGKYLTINELTSLIAPSPLDIHTIMEWLHQHGVESSSIDLTQNNDFIEAVTTVEKAEQMLAPASFHHYQFVDANKVERRIVRSSVMYSLPKEIADVVAFVGGVVRFPSYKTMRTAINHQEEKAAKAALAITPHVLRKHYNVSDTMAKSQKNSQSVAQFLGQHYSKTDLSEFFDIFFWPARGHQPKIIGPDSGLAGVEASLDIEYIMSVGANIPTVFWSTAAEHENQEAFLDWAVAVSNTSDAPYVHSVSYGDDEDTVSQSYAARVDVEFMKLGARGISILFASGDDGVGGAAGACSKFVPNYPASSPYVTAVGGTTFSGAFENGVEVTNTLSGGGFSNYYPRTAAPYQAVAVDTFFNRSKAAGLLPASSYYNSLGRGYPDISAMSSGFVVVVNFIPTPGVAGTSCASPTAAAIFSLLNDLRLQNGKSTLGFLNPFIYQTAVKYPGAFYDVVNGANPNCGTNGFWAVAGWDASSGVGTPNYAKLATVVTSMP